MLRHVSLANVTPTPPPCNFLDPRRPFFSVSTTRTYTPDLFCRILTYYMEWEIQFFFFLNFPRSDKDNQPWTLLRFDCGRLERFLFPHSFFSLRFDSIIPDGYACCCASDGA